MKWPTRKAVSPASNHPISLGLVRREVNQEFQRVGIEEQINKIQQENPEHVELYSSPIPVVELLKYCSELIKQGLLISKNML